MVRYIDLAQVRWGRKTNWDIRFVDDVIFVPFTDFIPAIDVEINDTGGEGYAIDLSYITIDIPYKLTKKTMKITFLDDDYMTVYEFLSDWYNSIYRPDGTILPPGEAIKRIEVRKFTNTGDLLNSTIYSVYPIGELPYSGESSSTAIYQYSVSFQIMAKSKAK